MRVPVVPRIPGDAPAPKRAAKSNGHTQDLAEWAGPPKTAKPPKTRGPKSHARNHADARQYAQGHIDKKDWSDATPIAIVGLYSLLHARVYGVLPAELDGPEYLAACSRARSVCRELHPQGAYEMVRWTWKQAERREKERKDGDDFRIGWRYQFSPKMITNFKVAQARAGKRV